MNTQKQRGFTFVELVIVVVILGLLAAVALPRFINLTDEAEVAAAEGVGGGFAAAVGLVRAQWEVDGRRNDNILLNGSTVNVNQFGYPTNDSNRDSSNMSSADCGGVFDDILQSTPSYLTSANDDLRDARYYVRVETNGVGTVKDLEGNDVANVDMCHYFLTSALELDASTGRPETADPVDAAGTVGFSYNPGTGQIISFDN
ncbi:prepilin-type N-terminal cleavage/methylation domain-containing protein [Ferrimonas lipolytica]|uniref:Prepilin-type N-terminal cleavage/methylation domain-containing protein n=1 Tax=Ferrimonas lipolytica TaxID=2724191 RepID=A0A6H1UGG8_9GAMM|nr:prepilin-type N-terminal cleavage/methylation domain-containing protein [Ferrimonas lipolytica]QIZ77918.1 prepilin-type N-terminal cleavage/methylation domain-containing protein [Ferrimonas lipolytica]